MNIYFSGLGGVGIGPLAEIAYDAGYKVQGSDFKNTPLTYELRQRGIAINTDQDGSFLQACHNVQPIDWFVYTSALPPDHPELVLARKLGIKTAKRDELLAYIIEQKGLQLIAIAGTHGKTTTTGMLIWTMQRLGVPISYSIGTTISFGPSGKFDPASRYFIYECDEFDRNFLQFRPYLSLITTIDYDHSDTYPNRIDYLEAFRQFGAQSRSIVTWRDQANDLFTNHPDITLLDTPLDIKLAGAHNRRNATLVAEAVAKLQLSHQVNSFVKTSAARVSRGAGALAETRREAVLTKDVDLVAVQHALETFPGTDRRFEKLADNLYTDYAHHPNEIAATLQMASELSDHVVTVYQPHQNIRQHELQDQYTNCFEGAESIYWLPTYQTRENPDLPVLQPADLTKNLTNKNVVHIADMNDELWTNIQRHRDAGHLVLVMGAGTIDDWVRQHLI